MAKIASPEQYKPRIMDAVLAKYLETFGIVIVEGPKYCGKSWLSSHQAKSEFLLADSSNNFQNRELALTSPTLILEGTTPRLIDEYSEIPSIFDAVRYEVDRRGKAGQFILTGSSTPPLNSSIHTGTGRVGRLSLRTMSLYESGDSNGAISLQDICEGHFSNQMFEEESLSHLAFLCVRGGLPAVINKDEEQARLLNSSYMENVLVADLKKVDAKLYSKRKMSLLLRYLARNEATTASLSKLLKDIKEEEKETLDPHTAKRYLEVFKRLYLFHNQPPFASSVRSIVRIKQAEKRHLFDPAMACALLGLSSEGLISDLKTFGFIFEALVERDLDIYASSFGAKLFHYQDYEGNEIDAVIELSDGRWSAFEIKLGVHHIDEAAKNLLRIAHKIKEEGKRAPDVLCVISGMSHAAYLRSDGVYVLPITALKN